MEKYVAKEIAQNVRGCLKENAEAHIQNRGINYFLEGNIVDVIYEETLARFKFLIKGSSIYQCFYRFDDFNQVVDSDCDCPYDAFCKHQSSCCFLAD